MKWRPDEIDILARLRAEWDANPPKCRHCGLPIAYDGDRYWVEDAAAGTKYSHSKCRVDSFVERVTLLRALGVVPPTNNPIDVRA